MWNDSAMTDEAPGPSIGGRFRSITSVAAAGIVFSVLSVVSLTLLNGRPEPSDSAAEIAEWYSQGDNRFGLILGLNLAVFSAIAFLWFVAVIRQRLGDREGRFFATVFFGSAILYAALMLGAAAVGAADAVAIELRDGVLPDPGNVSFNGGLGEALMLIVVPRVQSVFVLTTSTLLLRTGVLARWVAYFGYFVALTMLLLPVLLEPMGFGFPIWVAVVSIVFLVTKDDR
jgi:hypothetical protein